MDALPHWPEGTVAVLTTHPAHAIPVSLALRAGDRELVVGLAPRRRSLEHLRADPRCAVTVMARGLSFTAHGHAVAFGEPDPVVAVRIEVDEIADHDHPTFEIDAGVAWRWTDATAADRDAAARAALARPASEGA
ncbi:MAG TPA: hypothetical protein VKB28_11940 [Solirubrobacteraceae bacterium]|nr:hypothetical protein [Solirubrobacteraceae bacterium]